MKRKDIYSLNSSGKLTENRVVEYTKPLDILQRKDRKVLYELLFRLAEYKPLDALMSSWELQGFIQHTLYPRRKIILL